MTMTPRMLGGLCVVTCLGFSVPGLAEEDALPFSMLVPDDWRTETIPFPLEFAPDLPYVGLEELRFAPGMFDRESEEFWTYAFVWWVTPDAPSDGGSLSRHLESYFRGLAKSVAESRQVEVGEAVFSAAIEVGEGGAFSGVAETFDAFVTSAPVRLNVTGETLQCPNQDRVAILFTLSPQAVGHPVWQPLDAIRQGFRCDATDATTSAG